MFTDNVEKVLSIFTKLVARLDKIIEKKKIEIADNKRVIQKLEEENDIANNEIAKAEKAIIKMSDFLV